MSRFIKNSNLPQYRVSALICGGLNEQLIEYLNERDIEIIYTDANRSVDKAVSNHADISVLYLGDGKIIVDRSQNDLIRKLRLSGLNVYETKNKVEGKYPYDCILNHTIIGNIIIGKSKIFDESVNELCENMDVISVNQGYCKCSVLVVDDNSIITDDESIARSAVEKGINTLLVSKGDVYLDGHEYGFIGGAGGKISKDEIVFFGDITKHSDYIKINEFIDFRGSKIIYFDFPLTDFGGIIPIKEKIV